MIRLQTEYLIVARKGHYQQLMVPFKHQSAVCDLLFTESEVVLPLAEEICVEIMSDASKAV